MFFSCGNPQTERFIMLKNSCGNPQTVGNKLTTIFNSNFIFFHFVIKILKHDELMEGRTKEA